MPRDPMPPAAGRSPPSRSGRARRIAALCAELRGLEGGAAANGPVVPLGVAALDRRLPGGGLAQAALHEVQAASPADAGTATSWCAILLARALRLRDGPALWCLQPRVTDGGEIYPPTLARFGLDPGRVIALHARRNADVLWAMEEALASRAVAAVLGELGASSGLTASRRLQLAAEKSGATALLLRPAGRAGGVSAAVTLWCIAAAPSRPRGLAAALSEPGDPRWRVKLTRCRGGAPGAWFVEWRDETGDLALAAPVRDRPGEPRTAAVR